MDYLSEDDKRWLKKCDKKTVMRLIIQLADFWASRKWYSFVIDDFTRNEIE